MWLASNQQHTANTHKLHIHIQCSVSLDLKRKLWFVRFVAGYSLKTPANCVCWFESTSAVVTNIVATLNYLYCITNQN